jgi:hypothetical protein
VPRALREAPLTPREALTLVAIQVARSYEIQVACSYTRETKGALDVLEKLVRKDEADKRYAQHDAVKDAAFRPTCTCGTHIPCIMWGHS